MRKFFAVMLAAMLAPAALGLGLMAWGVLEARAQAKQASATLKVTCMSDGTMRLDSDAAPR